MIQYTQLVWPSTRGVARSPQGSPKLWRWPAGGEVRGPISEAVTVDGAGTAAVETGIAPPVQGAKKNRSVTGKMVPGPSLSGDWEGEGEETRGSENETCLVAAGPPGRLPIGRPRHRRLPGVASASVQALRRLTETISSRNPTLMVKERGPRRKMA
jgi:hypothetical protein